MVPRRLISEQPMKSALLFFRVATIVWSMALIATSFSTIQGASPLKAETFRRFVEEFNASDEELYKNAIPNAKAWEFLEANIPLFECPDEELMRTYYFRWWTYRKHLRDTPDGWVITEYLPKVPWSAKHNTICCPAGHHFY